MKKRKVTSPAIPFVTAALLGVITVVTLSVLTGALIANGKLPESSLNYCGMAAVLGGGFTAAIAALKIHGRKLIVLSIPGILFALSLVLLHLCVTPGEPFILFPTIAFLAAPFLLAAFLQGSVYRRRKY